MARNFAAAAGKALPLPDWPPPQAARARVKIIVNVTVRIMAKGGSFDPPFPSGVDAGCNYFVNAQMFVCVASGPTCGAVPMSADCFCV